MFFLAFIAGPEGRFLHGHSWPFIRRRRLRPAVDGESGRPTETDAIAPPPAEQEA
jgi:hypothetical protein